MLARNVAPGVAADPGLAPHNEGDMMNRAHVDQISLLRASLHNPGFSIEMTMRCQSCMPGLIAIESDFQFTV